MQANIRKYKRAKMFRLVEDFLALGKTQKEFCRQHDICLSTFQFWLRLYRREKQSAPFEQAKAERAFIPIQVSSKDPYQHSEYGWTIEYPNGVRVRFTGIPERELLLSLIQAV